MSKVSGGALAPVIPIAVPPVVPPVVPDPVTPISVARPRTLGIDLSHYEPQLLSWEKAKAFGVAWMYTKASEGLSHVDFSLKAHCAGAKAAGVLTQAYHFFHASLDGTAQAKFYLRCVDGMRFELPHILDWESSSAEGQSTVKQQVEAMKWLDAVEAADGRAPWIYAGESFMRDLKVSKAFARYPLIVAHYGCLPSQVRVPAPWLKYTAWQFTDAGSVAGLSPGHHVDSNWFNGSNEDLMKLARF